MSVGDTGQRWGANNTSNLERASLMDVAFSLTLTLSRWEREQPVDPRLKFVSQRAEGRRRYP